MKKNSYIVASTLAYAVLATHAYAVPMFSEQTGMDCTGCHSQHIAKLNSFGRQFMASGMTLSKQVADANGSAMDIGVSAMLKSMYERTTDKPTKSGQLKDWDTEDGDWSVPKTASLFVGGRVVEQVGVLTNFSYKSNDEEDNSISGKIVYAKEIEDGYWGVSAYSVAEFGPFGGIELYNTGLYKPFKGFDQRKLSNAIQSTNIGSGEAAGVQLYIYKGGVFLENDYLFATAGFYNQGLALNDNALGMGDNLLPFARVAYEYPLGDFNLILGAFAISGGSTVASTEDTSIKRKTFGMDMQIEGVIADKSVELTLARVFKNEITYTGLYAAATEDLENIDNKSFSIAAEVNVLPELGLKAAYLTFDDSYDYPDQWKGGDEPKNLFINAQDLDHAYTIGADYSFKWYADMKLSVEYAWAKPSLDRVEDYRVFIASLSVNF